MLCSQYNQRSRKGESRELVLLRAVPVWVKVMPVKCGPITELQMTRTLIPELA